MRVQYSQITMHFIILNIFTPPKNQCIKCEEIPSRFADEQRMRNEAYHVSLVKSTPLTIICKQIRGKKQTSSELQIMF